MSYAHPRSSTRRLAGVGITVVLHIVLIYALIHGLARKIVEVVAPPLETKIIAEVRPPAPEKPPPPPPPKLATPPPPYIPPPEVQIQLPVQPPPTISVAPSPTPPPPVAFVPTPAPPAPPQQAARAPERIADSCEMKPPYTAASRRAGEEGEVRVRALVDVSGRVMESSIERSSGYSRLDEASREAILACKYRPAIGADGRPTRAWTTVIYVWRLRDN
jgi:protein TonB